MSHRLTAWMEQTSSWDSNNHSANSKILSLWNPKVRSVITCSQQYSTVVFWILPTPSYCYFSTIFLDIVFTFMRATCTAKLILLDFLALNSIWWTVPIWNISLFNFFHVFSFSLSFSDIFFSIVFLNSPSACVFSLGGETKFRFHTRTKRQVKV